MHLPLSFGDIFNRSSSPKPMKKSAFDLHTIKELFTLHRREGEDRIFKLALAGEALLNNPRWNKGMGFTRKEREEFDLVGRLPSGVNSLDEQCERAYNQAEAISNYSQLFRKSEGLFLSYPFRERMEKDFLHYIKGKSVDLIVVSDSEAILGIGDQGVGGIGISTAKAVVYTLVGGIDPSRTLPIVLDVGTDNRGLLDDKLYVGWSHKRVRGTEYDEFIETFVQLVRKHLPHCLIHFEDFGVDNARRILEKYRSQHAIFNDDIQGTGAVTLSALMSAVGVTKSKLSDQRIVVYGAGSAGLGIIWQLRDAMVRIDGISREEASQRFYMIDKDGLITKSFGSKIRHGQEDFVRPDEEWDDNDRHDGKIGLLQVVKKAHPTVLIGTSTHAGGFTEEIIKEMATLAASKHTDRPIIFPLSNPTRLVEVDPSKANEWTEGKALLATGGLSVSTVDPIHRLKRDMLLTGSPFPPAKMPNGKDYIIAECNNALIYPGIGFGAVLAESKTISDSMIIAGAQALASLSPALKDPDAALLPDFGDAPHVNFEVAVAVAEHAVAEGLAGVKWQKEDVRDRVKERIWHPVYGTYHYDASGEK
ncbi:NAD-dependent malic enzyme, mitochondrial [Tulasnella sp. UAMH 9824]|nr:NAD-dependent malic enzyme, mitochondrial [Tulasnella sp. UAMH 9824]